MPESIESSLRALKLRLRTASTTVTLVMLSPDLAPETIEAIKAVCPETTVEVLVQDFDGDQGAIERVLAAEPEIFSHNIETVRPLFSKLRDRRFTYDQSLEVLRFAATFLVLVFVFVSCEVYVYSARRRMCKGKVDYPEEN